MVTAMLDLVRQDFSSALSRAAYVLMVMASAGVAVWTVTFLFNWQVEATDVSVPTGWVLHVLRCLCSFVAAYGHASPPHAPSTRRSALIAEVKRADRRSERVQPACRFYRLFIKFVRADVGLAMSSRLAPTMRHRWFFSVMVCSDWLSAPHDKRFRGRHPTGRFSLAMTARARLA